MTMARKCLRAFSTSTVSRCICRSVSQRRSARRVVRMRVAKELKALHPPAGKRCRSSSSKDKSTAVHASTLLKDQDFSERARSYRVSSSSEVSTTWRLASRRRSRSDTSISSFLTRLLRAETSGSVRPSDSSSARSRYTSSVEKKTLRPCFTVDRNPLLAYHSTVRHARPKIAAVSCLVIRPGRIGGYYRQDFSLSGGSA